MKGHDTMDWEVYKGRELPDKGKKKIRIRTLRERKWTMYHSMNGVPFCVRIVPLG